MARESVPLLSRSMAKKSKKTKFSKSGYDYTPQKILSIFPRMLENIFSQSLFISDTEIMRLI